MRNWPYWLRGGAILGGLGLVAIVLTWLHGVLCFNVWSCYSDPYAGFGALGLVIIANLPGVFLLNLFGSDFSSGISFFIMGVVSIIVYFIIGAIVGLIIGKFVKD